MAILGIDASTRCVGWCLLNDDGSLHDIGYVWLGKLTNEYERIDALESALENSIKISGDVSIFIEAPLQRSNNQNVVNILQRWNGFVCSLLYWRYNVQPVLIPELTVRKLNDIKVPKGVKGKDKKMFCLHYVQSLGIIPEDKWELKRTGNPCDWSYDMADAYCVARAGFLQ